MNQAVVVSPTEVLDLRALSFHLSPQAVQDIYLNLELKVRILYVDTHAHWAHTSSVILHTVKQVGSFWVNECLFFGNTQGCLMRRVYLRLL